MGVLLQELLRQRAEGVELHACHQTPVGVLLAHGVDGGAELRGGVGEILIHRAGVTLLDELQALRGTLEGGDGLVELLIRHPHLAAGQAGGSKVE